MNFKILDNTNNLREAFIDRFIMTWEEFQDELKDFIAEMEKKNYSVDIAFYEQSYMWDKMSSAFPRVSLEEALAFLRECRGSVLFMSENSKVPCYRGKMPVDFIAEADAHALAEKIEQEWYGSYRLAMQDMYDPNAILPVDLYVFDSSMKWCVVFTHETTDWESEIDNPMKAAQSRYCIICKV